MGKQNTVKVKLLGDPGSSFYNFGTGGKQEWRKGGDVVEIDVDLAEKLVLKNQAMYVDVAVLDAPRSQHKPEKKTSMVFDQDTPEAGDQEKS